MTPTGLVLCAAVVAFAIFVPGPQVVPVAPLVFLSCFLLLERRPDALRAIRYGVLVVAPIALYLSIVWILVVGSRPAAGVWLHPEASRSATAYVVNLSSKLFLSVVLLHASLVSPLAAGALRFLVEIKLPKSAKIVIALTLSTASTIRASAERAWLSLTAANLVAPRMAWRNARNCGLLVLTVWLSIVGTVSARLRTKWLVEDIRSRLEESFHPDRERSLTWRDLVWIGAGLAAAAASAVAR
jgi:hypothetical protein